MERESTTATWRRSTSPTMNPTRQTQVGQLLSVTFSRDSQKNLVSPLRNEHRAINIHSEISQYIIPHYIILTAANKQYMLFIITKRQSKYSSVIKSPSNEHINYQGFYNHNNS